MHSFRITKADIEANGANASLVNQIFVVVDTAVRNKQAAPGMRMPSVRQLAADCGISRDTAARAYDKLVAQGILESRRGAGFYVKARPSRPSRGKHARLSHFASKSLDDKLRIINPPDGLVSRSGTGYLPGEWMNDGDIAGEIRAVARTIKIELDRPGSPQGYLPLREQIDLILQDYGIHAGPANVIVTNGATQALSLIVQWAVLPGSPVLVEQPTQQVLIERLMASGAEILFVPRLADGPDLVTLQALCSQHKPRLFFCNTSLHNPTSGHVAPHVAYQLLRIAEQQDLVIVEDDVYSPLLPPTTPVTRLASLDQLRRVIYVGSFSKALPPSLRVGYLAANPETIEWMIVHRALGAIATNDLAERVVFRLLSEGSYRHHCEQIRSRLAETRPRVIQTLRSLGIKVEHEPDAGLYIWADLGDGIDASVIAARLLKEGHLVAPGRLFSDAHPSHMRFNIGETLNAPLLAALGKALGQAQV